MKQQLRKILILCLGFGFFMQTAQAQVVNFEDTWQEFLKNEKTSNVSKLGRPEKAETVTFLKFCLMYANSHFCAGEMPQANQYITEIKALGEAKYAPIPAFKAKYDDLTNKMAASVKLDGLWQRFTTQKNVTLAEIAAIPEAKKVCDKGTLAKTFYMESHAHYCKGDIPKAKENFEGRVIQLTEKTSFDMKTIKGMPAEIKMMKELFAGIAKLDPAWAAFISSGKSAGFDTELPVIDCYTIPNVKVYILRAYVDPCKNGNAMLVKIRELLAKNTSQTVPADVKEKIEWLEKEVGSAEADLATLNKAWKEFVPTDKFEGGADFVYDYPCHRDAQIKAYIMDGTANICEKGAARLADIEKVRKASNPTLDAETLAKLKNLETKVKKYEADLANLNKVWAAFIPNDALDKEMTFAFEYPCHREAEVRAAAMYGILNACTKGRQMLTAIDKTTKEHSPTLDAETPARVEKLTAIVTKSEAELADLNTAWKEFVAGKDTLLRPLAEYKLVEVYCDKVAQIKSWIIKGSMNPCPEGQGYLTKIDGLVKSSKVTLDAEVSCRVTRLRIKVWDCRYWEIVEKARKETHEERERFGPVSSAIMQADLNGKGVVCPTTVKYEGIGYIGIKYSIIVSLCQPIDVAKMGDPEYYKKIATWVNTQVLAKYCLANMRCKEGFNIYIEGHTDGNAFSGANYKESLGIPKGTKFTHFAITPATKSSPMRVDTLQKVTEREIAKDLKNNMELGIARAWSIKQQLDFMQVPIGVGAYEHPANEKGGEYRRIETQLNITNLLLDFYEKRLKDLLDASGIGERPKGC